jgi:hypothetical protein
VTTDDPGTTPRSRSRRRPPIGPPPLLAGIAASVVVAAVFGAMVFLVQRSERGGAEAAVIAGVVAVGTLVVLVAYMIASRRVVPAGRRLPLWLAVGPAGAATLAIAGAVYRGSIVASLIGSIPSLIVFTVLYRWLLSRR